MNTALDINTARGRIAAEDQKRAVDIVFKGHSRFNFIHTATNDSAAVDGLVVRDWIATAIAEVKSRDTSYETLMGSFHGEWLLTHQKLLDVQTVSKLLRLPAYGLLYLTKSDMVLVIVLTNLDGELTCRHREEVTETQRTCNGGTATRLNSFIDVKGAKIYRGAA